MAKKNFKPGVDGMIRDKDVIQVEIDSKKNVPVEIKKVEKNLFGFSSIDVDKDISKAFKIAVLRKGTTVHDFFFSEVNKLIENKTLEIPVVEDKNLGKYSFRLYTETKKELRAYCLDNGIKLKDTYIYLMKLA